MRPDLKEPSNAAPRRGRGLLWFVAGGVVVLVVIFAFPAIRNSLKHARTAGIQGAKSLGQKISTAPASASSPTFDFYRLLSHPTQILTSGESGEVKPQPATPAPVTQPGGYVLQVASVRNARDAGKLKARLALWGIRAHVQAVQIQGETWHRIRIGPVDDLTHLNALREKLDAHHLKPLLIRVSD